MGIKIYNLERSQFEEEPVCAEAFMRFLYRGGFLGRASVSAVFARAFFSKIFGLWADSKISARAIGKFVSDKKINMAESLLSADAFKCWNDFFTRELVPSARPIAEQGNGRAISFPSDGRHLLIRNIGENTSFYAKNSFFSLADFLCDEKLAELFYGGDMLISRLSPLDYHRFHFPFDCEILARKEIKGVLESVSTIALKEKLSILWRNKRVLNILENPLLGRCAFVEIGATNVGTIVNFSKIGSRNSRGTQAGMFKFGGSCVVTLIPRGVQLQYNKTLLEMSAKGIESYAKVNSLCAEIK